MKQEIVVAVDEATRKFMNEIHDDICGAIESKIDSMKADIIDEIRSAVKAEFAAAGANKAGV